MNKRYTDRIWAAAATAAIAAIILLTLFFTGLTWDKAAIAQSSIPEGESPEELFIEPELLELPGEELPDITDAPEAPAENGQPEQAPEENRQVESPGKNEQPEAPKAAKPVTQTKPSPVKVTEPKKTESEPKKATNPTAGKFSTKNGSTDGKNAGQGTGTKGTAKAQGSVRGREFKGADRFTAEVSQKTVVVIAVTVNADGKVIWARVQDGGGASKAVQNQCKQNAYTARWTAKPGAPDANGTIRYTITPKL